MISTLLLLLLLSSSSSSLLLLSLPLLLQYQCNYGLSTQADRSTGIHLAPSKIPIHRLLHSGKGLADHNLQVLPRAAEAVVGPTCFSVSRQLSFSTCVRCVSDFDHRNNRFPFLARNRPVPIFYRALPLIFTETWVRDLDFLFNCRANQTYSAGASGSSRTSPGKPSWNILFFTAFAKKTKIEIVVTMLWWHIYIKKGQKNLKGYAHLEHLEVFRITFVLRHCLHMHLFVVCSLFICDTQIPVVLPLQETLLPLQWQE